MKIFLSNILRITPAARHQGSFSSLSVGDRIEADLIRKTGQREALINIAGTRIHARFTGHVPDSPRLSLILEGFRNGSYIFNLDSADALKKNLSFFRQILLTEEINLHRLNSLPVSRTGDLFALNLLLLGVPLRERMGGHSVLLNFLNGLSVAGFGREDLFRISMLFFSNLPDSFLAVYRQMMKRKEPFGEKEYRETINKLLENVDKLDENRKSDCIKELFVLSRRDNFLMTIPFFDGEGFSSLKVIRYNGYVFISTDFSALGRIDIIMRKNKDYYDASVVFDDSEKRVFFNEQLPGITEELIRENINIKFQLYDRHYVEAQLLNLKNEFMTGGSFNTRI